MRSAAASRPWRRASFARYPAGPSSGGGNHARCRPACSPHSSRFRAKMPPQRRQQRIAAPGIGLGEPMQMTGITAARARYSARTVCSEPPRLSSIQPPCRLRIGNQPARQHQVSHIQPGPERDTEAAKQHDPFRPVQAHQRRHVHVTVAQLPVNVLLQDQRPGMGCPMDQGDAAVVREHHAQRPLMLWRDVDEGRAARGQVVCAQPVGVDRDAHQFNAFAGHCGSDVSVAGVFYDDPVMICRRLAVGSAAAAVPACRTSESAFADAAFLGFLWTHAVPHKECDARRAITWSACCLPFTNMTCSAETGRPRDVESQCAMASRKVRFPDGGSISNRVPTRSNPRRIKARHRCAGNSDGSAPPTRTFGSADGDPVRICPGEDRAPGSGVPPVDGPKRARMRRSLAGPRDGQWIARRKCPPPASSPDNLRR